VVRSLPLRLAKAKAGLVEKAAAVRALEKATTGRRRSGEGGRPVAALGRSGDVGRRSQGSMEREARGCQGGVAERSRGAVVR
jgi:hypothetical protein